MCTEYIQIIDSSIPTYHTSSILTQTSQQHLKSYIASPVGHRYNDNRNNKSSYATAPKPLPRNLKSRDASTIDFTPECLSIENIACSTAVKEPIGMAKRKIYRLFHLYI
jgi:hypothetical protein